MKFEKFVKKAMPHATTLTVGGAKWLAYSNMFVKVPEWCGDLGIKSNDTDTLEELLFDENWGEEEATLTKAYLPSPDAKAKDIMREYSDGRDSVSITNEQFSMIETHDMTLICTLEDGSNALLVGKYADIDDFEPDAVIMGGVE